MPPRKLRPSIEERALRAEQRMGFGSISGRVESAAPARAKKVIPRSGFGLTSLGSQADKAISDDLTLSDGATGTETFIWTSPPGWLASGKIISPGLYQASVLVGADASITAGTNFWITFLPSGVYAYNPSVLFIDADLADNHISDGAWLIGTWPFGSDDIPVVIETFDYQNFAGEDVIINLVVQRLAW